MQQAAVAVKDTASLDWQRSVYAVTTSQFLVFVAFNFVNPFLPLFIQELGVHDPGQVRVLTGLQSTAASVGVILMAPIWGWLADRHGRKPMVVRALASAAVCSLLTGFVQNVWQLFLVRFLMGATTGTQGAAMALVSTLSPRSRVGYSVGLIQTANYVGLFVGPLVGGILADTIGIRHSAMSAAVIAGLACLCVATFTQEKFQPPARQASIRRASPWRNARQLMAVKQLPPLMVTILAASMAIYAIPPLIPLFVQTLPNVTAVATSTGVALATAGMCSAVSSPLLGRYGSRLGYLRILIICAAGVAVVTASLALVHGVVTLVLVEALLGLFTGGVLPVAYMLLSLNIGREHQGALYGLSTAVASAGQGIGPVAAGLFAAVAGIRPVFLMSGAMCLGVAALAGSLVRERRADSRLVS